MKEEYIRKFRIKSKINYKFSLINLVFALLEKYSLPGAQECCVLSGMSLVFWG